MAQSKTELLVGAATVKIGANVIGYTRGGVGISMGRDRTDIECDQTTVPLYREVSAESASITFSVLQISLTELKAAGILKANGVFGLSTGEAESSYAVEVYGTRKDGQQVKFTFPACTVTPGEITSVKGDAATCAVTLDASYDESTGGLFTMTEPA